MNIFVTLISSASLIGIALFAVLKKSSNSFLLRQLFALNTLVFLGALVGLLPINSAKIDTEDNSVDVLFLVDTTYSMYGKDGREGKWRIDDAKADIIKMAQAIPGSRFAVSSFKDRTSLNLPFTKNIADLEIAMQTISPGDQLYSRAPMNLSASLDQTYTYLKAVLEQDTSRQRIIVLLTDGELTGGEDSIDKVVASAERLDEIVDQALIIGYGSEEGAALAYISTDYDTGKLYEKTGEFDKVMATIDGEYKEVVSKKDQSNLDAITLALSGVGASSNSPAENVSQLTSLQRKSIKDASKSPEQLALQQNVLHVPFALLFITLLFLFEVVKVTKLRRPLATIARRKS